MFVVKYDENNKRTYLKVIKSFFGKKKYIKVNKEEVFKPFLLSGNIIPEIQGMNLDTILFEKHDFNIKYKLSDFLCKVKFKIDKYDSDIKLNEEKDLDGNDTYSGKVNLNGSFYNTEGIKVCDFGIESYIDRISYKPTKEYYEELFTAAYSGIYSTPRSIDKIFNEISKTKHIDNVWHCEVCGEEFSDVPSFFNHLLEEKHFDSVLDEYPNDREVLNIRRVLRPEKC